MGKWLQTESFFQSRSGNGYNLKIHPRQHFGGKLSPPLAHYAVHRWFNFWSAQAIEMAFCAQPAVHAHPNAHNRLIDFYIHDIPFDHKTSVFPARYDRSLIQARRDTHRLIRWLYDNQSQYGRYHLGNRLFIILYAHHGAHWKLCAEVTALARVIEKYVAQFNPDHLTKLSIADHKVWSDVLWYVK